MICLSSSISELDCNFCNSFLARSSRELHCLRSCQDSELWFQESVCYFPFIPKLTLFAGVVYCPLWTASKAFRRRLKFLPASVTCISEGFYYMAFPYILESEIRVFPQCMQCWQEKYFIYFQEVVSTALTSD